MTVHELAGRILRRWYVYAVMLGLVLLLILLFGNSPRIYSTTAEVNFDAPAKVSSDRQNQNNTETLIDFAGAVVTTFDAKNQNIVLSSPNASVFGNGVRVGTSVSLASFGSQWETGFDRPTAVVRVAEDNPDAVASRVKIIAEQLSTIGQQLQREAGVKVPDRITTSIDLDSLSVSSFGQTRTGKYKATAVLLSVGFIAATLAAIVLDRCVEILKSRVQHGRSTALELSTTQQQPSHGFPGQR